MKPAPPATPYRLDTLRRKDTEMSTQVKVPATAAAPGAGALEPSRRRRTPHGAGTSKARPCSSRTQRLTVRARNVARRVLGIASSTMVILAVAAFLLLAVGPRLFGYHTFTMLTGSMAPLINPGDVVVTTPTAVGDIQVGDVITYHIPVEDHRVETHRVTEILVNNNGTTAVRTKGDANNGVDPWIATLGSNTVDKHVFTVPYLGQAIRLLREPVILNALMYGAPAVLVGALLVSIWRREPEPAANGQ